MNAIAGGNACNPIIFEPMVMSILIGQQGRIRELEQKIKAMQPCSTPAWTNQELKQTDPTEPKITIPKAPNGGEKHGFSNN